jgi:hypothetical protein
MSSLRDLKLAQKAALQQQEVITELEGLVKDIARCEKMILDLKNELLTVNATYPSPRTTREDIGYLTDLLKCANRKLIWEKQIASLQKRAPGLLERMSRLMDDPKNPPPEQTRMGIVNALREVQAAMERLQAAKL